MNKKNGSSQKVPPSDGNSAGQKKKKRKMEKVTQLSSNYGDEAKAGVRNQDQHTSPSC